MTPNSGQPARRRLVVDPLACDGIGLCSHLAPGVVELDRWGFPIMPREYLTQRGTRLAERAIRGCPGQALALIDPGEART